MANIHLKVYDYIESEEQINRKKEFKKFITEYKDKVKDKEQKDKQQKEKDPDSFKEEPDPTEGVPDEELELIDKFLTGFMLQADSGNKKDQIDLKLALRALPEAVNKFNLHRCEMFNFESTKSSIIAFNNNN